MNSSFKQFHPLDWKEAQPFRPIARLSICARELSEELGIFFFEAKDDLCFYKAALIEGDDDLKFILREDEISPEPGVEVWAVARNANVRELLSDILKIISLQDEKIIWITDVEHEWEGTPGYVKE